MAKNKYVFDSETLTYIPVEVTFKEKFKKYLPIILSSLLIGVAAFAILAFGGYQTPKEKLQAQQLKDFKTNQELLNNRIEEANSTLNKLIAFDDSVYRTILGENALDSSVRLAGTGGTDKYADLKISSTPEEIIASFKDLDKLVAKMNVQEGSYKELLNKSISNINRLQHIPAIIPIANWDLKRIGSGFSPRRYHPTLKIWRPHEGIDFIAKTGTSIYASADGVVASVRFSDTFGKVVEIDHGFGLRSLYAHMSKFNVKKKGEKVKRGQVIGYVGSTGISSGPHLHYEVHVNGKEVNPVKYFFNDLTAGEYKAIVAQSESVETCME